MNNKPISQDVAVEDVLSFKGNPYGLVYDNAIMANEPGKVTIHPIAYDLNGLRIAANVYTPADYGPAKKYPALVVAHPNGGVKEQVAGNYAQIMAGKGYITLAFDAAYQGASGGEPRNTDKPANRVEDIHRAADILATYPGVDPDRMGILGICGAEDILPRLPRQTNASRRWQPSACSIRVLFDAMASWIPKSMRYSNVLPMPVPPDKKRPKAARLNM